MLSPSGIKRHRKTECYTIKETFHLCELAIILNVKHYLSMPKVGLLILDSRLCRLDSTFWLDSTLKLYCEMPPQEYQKCDDIMCINLYTIRALDRQTDGQK